MPLDPRIKKLPATTFSGRRFTRRQLAAVQETVAAFPKLSRKELAQTICEHFDWRTATGGNRVAAALGLLEALEKAGIVKLPAKRAANQRFGPRKPPPLTAQSAEQPPITGRLQDLQPLQLERVEGRERSALWNELVERHHYLGYRQPMGPHLRYFVLDQHQRPLACLLFNQATHTLACRDKWVGWPQGAYKKHLDLLVSQSRYALRTVMR